NGNSCPIHRNGQRSPYRVPTSALMVRSDREMRRRLIGVEVGPPERQGERGPSSLRSLWFVLPAGENHVSFAGLPPINQSPRSNGLPRIVCHCFLWASLRMVSILVW